VTAVTFGMIPKIELDFAQNKPRLRLPPRPSRVQRRPTLEVFHSGAVIRFYISGRFSMLCQGTTSKPVRAKPKDAEGALCRHDFSRAVNANKSARALALRECLPQELPTVLPPVAPASADPGAQPGLQQVGPLVQSRVALAQAGSMWAVGEDVHLGGNSALTSAS